ncbi:amino acid-binding protein [Kineothrix sedimenti]|uniref:Amino acid-binding protein n=1 Tax=Kineothrix sedimenti TaxID=3123317 RepID=A0ABZ3EQA8_9FIRM
MFIKQLSVFLENREGRLEDVLQVLKDNEVNIISLSLADTEKFGMLRLLVSSPEAAHNALKRNGFSSRLTDVLAIRISHRVGMLQELLEPICDAHINIEYMYALSTGRDDASMVLKTSDLAFAEKTLRAKGVEIIAPEEITDMQS